MVKNISSLRDRLINTEQFGFSIEATHASFGYDFPPRTIDKIMLKCFKCASLTPWPATDFLSKLVKNNRVYSCHSCKKYTLDAIQQKIDIIFGAGVITIAPGQIYTGIRDPMTFIDCDYGEWTSAAFNIITNKNTHPKRSVERRKKTNLVKYGHENAFGNETIKKKIKQTNLAKYGYESPMQAEAVKEKLRNSFIEKYGCPVPLVGNAEVLKKVKKTNLARHGREQYANVSHDMAFTQEYRCWVNMRTRCYNKNDISYPNYGGRGLTVCAEWLESFEQFYADMGLAPKDGDRYTIERIDTNQNYTPANCRWATYTEQANNKRNNVIITYNGRTQTMAQWADEVGLNRATFAGRLARGWGIDRTITTPARRR